MWVSVRPVRRKVMPTVNSLFPCAQREFSQLRALIASRLLKKNEKIEVCIESINHMGIGVANYNGEKIYIPTVLPGERVTAKIVKLFDDHCLAEAIHLVTKSAHRVEPKCGYYTVCNGCQFQHASYEYQQNWKKELVVRHMQAFGVDVAVKDVVASKHMYNYRTKITPHYNPPKRADGVVQIGFRSRYHGGILDVAQCAIATDAINVKLIQHRKGVRTRITESEKRLKKGASLILRDNGDGDVSTDHRDLITQRVGELLLSYNAGEFFQTNAQLLPALVQHVVDQAAGHLCDHLIDTYCGCGIFALSAASTFDSVAGIDISKHSIHRARENAKMNNITNATFVWGKVEELFKDVSGIPRERSVVVIDPSRSGCDVTFLTQLFEFSPRKVVYVACEPSTQARDAKLIVNAGYDIVDITPFDMFPQTRHVENVITFYNKEYY
mmetsp:Transcript_3167/g.4905  ORF Transcript_3167/g.4905 Transcript_3167/m.4905 type:complete len:440 (+) Transcript_3167:41-1360(+)